MMRLLTAKRLVAASLVLLYDRVPLGGAQCLRLRLCRLHPCMVCGQGCRRYQFICSYIELRFSQRTNATVNNLITAGQRGITRHCGRGASKGKGGDEAEN